MRLRSAYFTALKNYKNINQTEVKIILAFVHGVKNYSQLLFHFDEELTDSDVFFSLVGKVNEGFPIQYVLRETEFKGINLFVDQRVLIPRIETEELVDLMLLDIASLSKQEQKELEIADICTGSGAIGIAISLSLNKHVCLSDISPLAIEVATINKNKTNALVELMVGDSLLSLIEKGIKLDYIVANPPYIHKGEEVQENVDKYEPSLALYNEKDIYTSILSLVPKVSKEKITIMFEINEKEGFLIANKAKTILGDNTSVKIVKDYLGKERFLIIKWKQN